MFRRGGAVLVLPLVLAAGLLASCSVGGASDGDGATAGAPAPGTVDDGAGSGEPTAEESAPAGEAPVARRVDTDLGAPEGWQSWQVGQLVFAAPRTFEPNDELTLSGSTVTLTPAPSEDGETLGALAVYVEDAALGPLDVRAQLTIDVRTDQLGSPPLAEPRPLDVAGSEGGSLLLWEYEQVVEPTGRSVPAVLGEIDVLMAEGPQYSISVSGATEVLDLDDIETVATTTRVVGSPADV